MEKSYYNERQTFFLFQSIDDKERRHEMEYVSISRKSLNRKFKIASDQIRKM
jgi:hypothetical protein